jgi:hypothetical protein
VDLVEFDDEQKEIADSTVTAPSTTRISSSSREPSSRHKTVFAKQYKIELSQTKAAAPGSRFFYAFFVGKKQ